MTPPAIRVRGRQAVVWWGTRTAGSRRLPDFLVIGGQRCGTTSLYRALTAHPEIRRPQLHKGVNYFDMNYARGEAWYRGHFPTERASRGTRVFDASGYYMFHPQAPGRIVRDLPDVKLIAMVRDPVERAFSAYKHELARGFETEESFARAVELEDERLDGETERMLADPTYQSFSHRHHAYRRRGEYARLLAPFVEGVGRDRLLIIESESFFAEPEREFGRIIDFLDIARVFPESFDRHNARPGSGLDADVVASLRAHYAPHDAALAELLGRPPVWQAD